MPINITILSTSDIHEWHAYLLKTDMDDLTHTPEYCKIFEDYGDGVAECYIYEDDTGFILYPYIVRPIEGTEGFYDITTPYGYGGYIWSSGIDINKSIVNFRNEFTDYARSKNFISEFIRFHPKNSDQELSTPLLDSLTLHSWNPILDLTISLEEQKSFYRSGHIAEIKKAQKNGLQFKVVPTESYMDQFYQLYQSQMQLKKQTGYVNFSQSFFQALCENIPSNIQLGAVFTDSDIVSMAIFLRHGNYLDYFLSATNPDYYKISGNHFLIHNMSKAFRENNGVYLHLGGGHASLMYFKSGFSTYKNAFYIGKNIFDEEKYIQLTSQHYLDNKMLWDGQNDFFPSYRRFNIGGNSCS